MLKGRPSTPQPSSPTPAPLTSDDAHADDQGAAITHTRCRDGVGAVVYHEGPGDQGQTGLNHKALGAHGIWRQLQSTHHRLYTAQVAAAGAATAALAHVVATSRLPPLTFQGWPSFAGFCRHSSCQRVLVHEIRTNNQHNLLNQKKVLVAAAKYRTQPRPIPASSCATESVPGWKLAVILLPALHSY